GWIQRDGSPYFGFRARKTEARGHNADHLSSRTVKFQGPAHNVRIAAESTLPKTEADNAHAIVAGRVLAGAKISSADRRNTEHLEEIGADGTDRHAFRLAVSGEIRAACRISSHVFEGMIVVT